MFKEQSFINMSENIKSEKENIWAQKQAEVEKITDALNKGIDENIKETVIAFLVHKFPIHASCEGHLDEEYVHYPWIDIKTPEPENWEENENKQREWRMKNLKQ